MPESSASIRIDLSASVPAYEQIAGQLRGLLVAQKLCPGTLLPPVRQLAADLAVHFNTVAQAYRILAEEGWLDLRQGRGATVIPRSAQEPSTRTQVAFSRELHSLVASALSRGLSHRTIGREMDRLLKSFPSQPICTSPRS
jgi:GntR family transcriptional regulator